jgi:hypothetical protein
MKTGRSSLPSRSGERQKSFDLQTGKKRIISIKWVGWVFLAGFARQKYPTPLLFEMIRKN